jgi:hypothetical protein
MRLGDAQFAPNHLTNKPIQRPTREQSDDDFHKIFIFTAARISLHGPRESPLYRAPRKLAPWRMSSF